MPFDLPLAVLLVPIAIAVAAADVWYRRHVRAALEASDRWRTGPTMGDGEFLMRCEVPDEPFAAAVALAARRVIADLGSVPPETIRPEDSFARDLVALPFWDSLDWFGFLLDVERACGPGVRLPGCSVIDEATAMAGGHYKDLRVRHVVRATALAATGGPKKDALGEDW
jgi:hypothetical protein